MRRNFRRASGRDIAKIAVKVYMCRGCGLQFRPGERPKQCYECGRMDYTHFDSTGEAARYGTLALLEKVGEISDLRRQVKFPLCTIDENGLRKTVAHYIADFVYTREGAQVIEDYKGAMTDVASLKLRWMAGMGLPVKLTGD